MEVKYIVVRDKKTNRMKNFKSDWLHHGTIARDNGFESKDILECGIILDKQLFILECKDEKHLQKRNNIYIGGRLNDYQDMRLRNWLKGRELESWAYYHKLEKTLPDGD